MNRTLAALVLFLAPAIECSAALPRSEVEYPGNAHAVEYQRRDYGTFVAQLESAVEEFRAKFGGATFGVDATTMQPVPLTDPIEQAIMEMLRKSPETADEVRKQGGVMTAVFEIRPARQPANANVYLRASYAASDERFALDWIVDPAESPEREDITGVNVDMPKSANTP